MCLAIPGRLLDTRVGEGGMRFGRVQFGAVAREVCLAYVPDAVPGDYVIVHVGIAIQRLDEAAAGRTLALLDETLDGDALPD